MPELSGRHLLLLQGPAGPFFARVARQLAGAGARVTKVNFNGGEDLYYRGRNVVRYRGSVEQWPQFFEALVKEHAVDGVVLFGDCRPLHRAAVERANSLSLQVFVFEEGYLRPDFVTLERGGVNGHSRIPRDPAFYEQVTPQAESPYPPIQHAFLKSALHTAAYATAAAALRPLYPRYRHHRDIRPVPQAAFWLRGAVRRALHAVRDRELARQLETRALGPYFFVPLQVHLDSQLGHSGYASIEDFIREVVETFAEHAPKDHALVVKLHPMDRAYRDYGALLSELTQRHGLRGRLHYVDVVNLPAALRGARGTIVINSTVGLSSLTHGTPVKCQGTAVYDLPGLTHQGSLASFLREPAPVDRALYKRYRHWLRETNQLRGSVWSRLEEDPSRLLR
ncbi:MAG: capsular biosynthesis protein [Myxococcales bacterium]|nr:MAG: capsular biosynthesis protein [Myxococcales bacterium]